MCNVHEMGRACFILDLLDYGFLKSNGWIRLVFLDMVVSEQCLQIFLAYLQNVILSLYG